MCDTRYNIIPKDTLINLVLDMGRVIRRLDPAGEWCEVYWTNDGNNHGPAYNHALEDAATQAIFNAAIERGLLKNNDVAELKE